MGYRNLRECVTDLECTGKLIRIEQPVDPNLEAAEIQRRVFQAGGPAIYYASVQGCRFPMVSNLFGTMDRLRYIFRDSLGTLERLVKLAVDPSDLFRRPRVYLGLKTPWAAWHARPRRMRNGAVLAQETTVDQLPQLRCWPEDGGAYITLPQVYTEDPNAPGLARSNLGMYRIQISGGEYEANLQVGIHYQLHRGIGAHHAAALHRKEKLRVNIFVGGPPAMTVAAVMPMPEGMSELAFAGVLGRRRMPMVCLPGQLPISAEADFAITGYIEPKRELPEGPFGDHLGYYSLRHSLPGDARGARLSPRAADLAVHGGRPPAPGRHDVRQVDPRDHRSGRAQGDPRDPGGPRGGRGRRASAAIGDRHRALRSLRANRAARWSCLTLANAVLGYGQLSLAKYLLIVAGEDNPELGIEHVPDFLRHVLERADWRRDLHFQTCTTIDTLDYTGDGLNQGSKAIVAVAGPVRRVLPVAMDSRVRIPASLGFSDPRVFLPGILVIQGPPCRADEQAAGSGRRAVLRHVHAAGRDQRLPS